MLDIPYCFKKSKSLKNGTFERPLFKFINILMTHGRFEKMSRFFSKNSYFLNLNGVLNSENLDLIKT
jgi:hypothetical protein